MARPSWLAITGCCAWCIALYLYCTKPTPGTGPAGTLDSSNSSSSNSSSISPDQQLPSMPFESFAFEVHGRVQGVFFRKFTVAKAQALHLVGWCANTQRGTVMGECQGKPQALEEMKEWLCTEGSPHSHIERCDFKKERNIQQLEYQVFRRRPNVP